MMKLLGLLFANSLFHMSVEKLLPYLFQCKFARLIFQVKEVAVTQFISR